MNPIDRIKAIFRRDPPTGPRLRNKPGGLASVKYIHPDIGAGAMAGAVVTTVCLSDGKWAIEPHLRFAVTAPFRMSGELQIPGQIAIVTAMADQLLEPFKDVGDGAADESKAWLPPVPYGRPIPVIKSREVNT